MTAHSNKIHTVVDGAPLPDGEPLSAADMAMLKDIDEMSDFGLPMPPVKAYQPPAIAAGREPAKLRATRDRLKCVTLEQLRAATDVCMPAFERDSVTPTDAETAQAWLINEEWTRRGIAPAFRGLPDHNPGAAAPTREIRVLAARAKSEVSLSTQRHHLIFSRYVDLQWLVVTLGRTHQTFAPESWDRLQRVGLASPLAVKITQSDNAWPRHRVCDAFKIDRSTQAGLVDFVTKDTHAAIRAARRRYGASVNRR